MQISRRGVVAAAGALVAGAALAACTPPSRDQPSGEPSTGGNPAPSGTETPGTQEPGTTWRMPDEGAPHAATWMSLHVDPDIWGEDLAPEVRGALGLIAAAIARFEPVKILVDEAGSTLTFPPEVDPLLIPANDLWIRDTGPTFVLPSAGAGGLAGVDFNFNGWGDKQEHGLDADVAAAVCEEAKAPRLRTELVLEGGALEVDGEGTAIITESCVLNDNRNPGWSKAEVEAELKRLLGLEKIIWLPGIKGRDITDGHTDFYARFAGPGIVVAGRDDDPDSFDYAVTRRHLKLLEGATDAKGRTLDVRVLPGPSTVRPEFESDDFAAGYINFYVCNGAVISPEFGDAEADAFAKATLEELFPDREVVQLNIDPIAAGGGGIHCATQQQPREGQA